MAVIPIHHLSIVLAHKSCLTRLGLLDTDGAAFVTLVKALGRYFINCLCQPLAAVHGCSAFEHIRVAIDVGHSAFGSRRGVAIFHGIWKNAVSKAETLGSIVGLRDAFIKGQQVVVADIGIVVDFLAAANHGSCFASHVSFERLAHFSCHEALCFVNSIAALVDVRV